MIKIGTALFEACEELERERGISKEVLIEQGELMKKNQYGQHILNVAAGKIKY